MTDYSIKPDVLVAQISNDSLSKFNLGDQVAIIVSKTVRNQFKLNSIFEEYGKNRYLYIFDHIRPDAPFEDLDLIYSELKNAKLDGMIAIGGGSVIDAAKALSISFEGINYKDIFYGKASMPDSKVKLLAIPTTAGTGAELSFGAIIYDAAKGKKGGLRSELIQPNAVLIDSRLHNACPFKLKAEVGFDCFTHAVETYISKKSNPIIRMQSVNCINSIFNNLIPACKENDDLAMNKIAINSALMGINLAYSSTCLPHRIQYVIGPLTHTSHAKGLIALYRGWLSHSLQIDLVEWSNLMSDLNLTKDTFLEKVQMLKEELRINYSIEELGVKKEQLQKIAENVTGNMTLDPSYKDKNSIINILQKSF